MRLRDLVHTDRIELSVVYAPEGALEQTVTGAYITDLPDPSRFLSVGDVVLTSGMWYSSAADADRFVAALTRQHVVALIVGLVHLGHLPDDLLEACRRQRLTLTTISNTVSFKAVADAIAAAQAGAATGLAAKGQRLSAALAEHLARGESAEVILRDFRDEFEIDCWLMDAIGTVVGGVGPLPSREETGRIWNAMLGHDRPSPLMLPAADHESASAVTCWPVTRPSHDVIGYFVCRGDQSRLVEGVPIVVDAVIGALRVDLEVSARWRQASHSHVSDLVRVLVEDAVSPGELSARMRLEGLDPQQPTSVAIAEVADRRFPPEAVLEMIYRLFAGDRVRVVGCVTQGRVTLLLNGELPEEGLGAAPLPEAEEWLPLLGGRQVRIGVSDAHPGVGRLSASVVSAGERLRAARGASPVVICSSSELRTHRALLAEVGERTLNGFAGDLLGPLIDYDARHGADLVETLRVFLQNTGAWQESARQLHLHTNTLRYRISRVEELTGRTMSRMDDRVDFYLALEAIAPAADSSKNTQFNP
ncbi:MAG: helix-turn-helix domain-containing protein [Microbacterium sp.]